MTLHDLKTMASIYGIHITADVPRPREGASPTLHIHGVYESKAKDVCDHLVALGVVFPKGRVATFQGGCAVLEGVREGTDWNVTVYVHEETRPVPRRVEV